MDIDLYSESPELYELLQMQRPDYSAAIVATAELSSKHMAGRKTYSVADFCCGTGTNTLRLTSSLPGASECLLVDINEAFLSIARESHIPCVNLTTVPSDIIEARLTGRYDILLSVFAYHHIPNSLKSHYVDKIKGTLERPGVLTLTEIYCENSSITRKYYEKLLREVPKDNYFQELEHFLRQTALSTSFEFKVARSFAHDQFLRAGFKLLEGVRVWPNDDELGTDVGTFVEIWEIRV